MDFESLCLHLKETPQTWLVTGAAGFIGSHLVRTLLHLGQRVRGLDNLSACGMKNLTQIKSEISPDVWAYFELIEGDIREPQDCEKAVQGSDIILHHAALGSVPLSISNPDFVSGVNVEGTRNVAYAAERGGVKKIVFASSCAVYGDYTDKPNTEDQPLKPMSPYAEGKLECEGILGQSQVPAVALRYFNIYGPGQDPDGDYAAVIPKWITKMTRGDPAVIFGDGVASRDFCYVGDVVRANILAACMDQNTPSVMNIGSGRSVSMGTLFETIRSLTGYDSGAVYKPARGGDILHSSADIGRARDALGFTPQMLLAQGLEKTVQYFQGQS